MSDISAVETPPDETFSKGMARGYREIKDKFNGTLNSGTTTPPLNSEVKGRINSDLEQVIEHWEKKKE